MLYKNDIESMKKKKLPVTSALRQKAEEELAKLESKPKLMKVDSLVLNHELLVHQIELEMQNDELLKANNLTFVVAEKYRELYNLAPVGYFTLTNKGEIIEVNHCGSELLCQDAKDLNYSLYGFFVTDETKPIFNIFLEMIFLTKTNETCMVSLNVGDNIIKHVLLTGICTKNSKQCLIAVIDTTELISIENKVKRLEDLNNYFIGRELKMVELKKEINDLLKSKGLENKYLNT